MLEFDKSRGILLSLTNDGLTDDLLAPISPERVQVAPVPTMQNALQITLWPFQVFAGRLWILTNPQRTSP